MITDKELKRYRLVYFLRQPLYLIFVLFFWIRLLSKGYTDIGTIVALVLITLGISILAMYDWLVYAGHMNKYYKDRESK